MSETAINSAIEHLVRVDVSDRAALTEAARVLADTLGYRLSAKLPLVHAMFGGHYEHIDGRETYVGACGTVNASPLTGLWGCITCDGCIEALKDDEGGGPA